MPKKSRYKSVIDFLSTSEWAIVPSFLDTMHQILATRLEGKLSIEEIEARTGGSDKPFNSAYTVDGVRVIPIVGVISKRMNIFSNISGGVSTELLKQEIQEAMCDGSIKSILLEVDSSGGSVDGTFELSDFIHSQRGIKPIITFTDGIMCSAAYLIGSATDKVICTGTSQVGSIGVIMKHVDFSEKDKQDGVKETVLHSGKYKAVGSGSRPLSKEDREYMQEKLDYYYTLFVDGVARNRGVSSEKVLGDMADGRIFIGQQAVDVGLVDEIGTFDTSFKEMVSVGDKEVNLKSNANNNAQLNVGATKGGEVEMTFKELKEDKELYSAMKKECDLEVNADVTVLESKVSVIEAQLSTSNELIVKLETENKKRAAMQLETTRMAKANGLIEAKLKESKIPERLHLKVASLVDCTQYMKDEKEEDFMALVDAEVKDWESLAVDNFVVAGTGAGSKSDVDAGAKEQVDSDLADSIFAAI